LRDAVLSYKSGGITALDGLVEVLQLVLRSASFGPDFIVNIPSTIDKVRYRGFDTIGELSSELARRTKVQHRPILKFTRKIQDQVGLDRNARNENLSCAFTSRAAISGQIALIDDVITTGATVTAAARSLRICGAKKIYAISLCRT
jgi:ComF family protein